MHRILRPALAVFALTLPALLPAQSTPKKQGAQPSASRPATGSPATRPSPSPTASAPATSIPAEPAATASKPAQAPVREPEPAPAPPRARAAAPAKGEHVGFGIAAGLAAPMSSLGKAFSAGYTAGGFLTGRPEGFPVSLRGDLQYTRFAGKNEIVTPSYAVIQLTGAGVYDFPKAGGEKSPFFATAGLGLYRWSANDESQTDFGQNLGLGFNFRRYRFAPFVEGRFHFFNDVQYFTLTVAGHL